MRSDMMDAATGTIALWGLLKMASFVLSIKWMKKHCRGGLWWVMGYVTKSTKCILNKYWKCSNYYADEGHAWFFPIVTIKNV